MKWKLMFLTSLIGIPVSLASVYLLPRLGSFIAWIVVYILVAFIVAANTSFKKFAWNAILVAYLMLIYNGLIHFFLYDAYIANHPEVLSTLQKSNNPKTDILINNLVIGFIAAKILAVFTFFARVILGKKKANEQA